MATVPLPLAQTALSALNHVLRQQDWGGGPTPDGPSA
jgi:hypothetical protein